MKIYIPIAIAAVLSAVAALLYARQSGVSASPKGDENGHVLSSRWSEYEKAVSDDRPRKMLEILNGIKAEAVRQHLPVDFYDAARLCVERGRQVNWKTLDSLKNNFAREVAEFNDPLVTYNWGEEYGGKGTYSQLALVKENAVALQKTRNPFLWKQSLSSIEASYRQFITNDYEYLLWHLVTTKSY